MELKHYTYPKEHCGEIRCTTCGIHTDLIITARSRARADEIMQNVGGHCANCIVQADKELDAEEG